MDLVPRIEPCIRFDFNTRTCSCGRLPNQCGNVSLIDPSSIRQASTRQSFDGTADPNSYQDNLGMGTMGQDFSSILGEQVMHQEEQDLVNLMASSAAHGFNGQVSVPLNLGAGQLPFPIQPLSMRYNQRNFGIVPTNIQMFPQGMVSSPLAHYFSSIGLASNAEDRS